jgi:hypothetical protein
MKVAVRTRNSYFLTSKDKEIIKKWSKENVPLKELAYDMGTTYKHLGHMLNGRRSIPYRHIEYLRSRGIDLKE